MKKLKIIDKEFGMLNKDSVPMVTSRMVAEKFGREHFHVLRDIKNLECSEEFSQSNFGLSEYKDSRGKIQPMYLLTRDGFTILTMGFTGREAMAWKEKYIKVFNAMEKFIKDWNNSRLEALTGYAPMTLAIQEAHKEPKFYHYSNEADMINKIVLGMKAKEFLRNHELPETTELRSVLSQEELQRIVKLQKLNTSLIELGFEYKERKELLTNKK